MKGRHQKPGSRLPIPHWSLSSSEALHLHLPWVCEITHFLFLSLSTRKPVRISEWREVRLTQAPKGTAREPWRWSSVQSKPVPHQPAARSTEEEPPTHHHSLICVLGWLNADIQQRTLVGQGQLTTETLSIPHTSLASKGSPVPASSQTPQREHALHLFHNYSPSACG